MTNQNKKDKWIIVVDKRTYLFLVAVAVCVIYLLVNAILTYVGRRSFMDFAGDLFICFWIAIISIYLFVRFNTYSPFYNPDHPKPEKNNK